MWLQFGENAEEFVEISDTSASKKLKQLVIAVMWLWKVDKVISLPTGDALDITKSIEKCKIRLNLIQQMNNIQIQVSRLALIQRSTVTDISSDNCIQNIL